MIRSGYACSWLITIGEATPSPRRGVCSRIKLITQINVEAREIYHFYPKIYCTKDIVLGLRNNVSLQDTGTIIRMEITTSCLAGVWDNFSVLSM
jgi:hypothetical protein